MISFKDVSFSYTPTVTILRDVDFTIERGEFVAIVGSNGAGKSTMLRLMNGLLKPGVGEVFVDGLSTHTNKTSKLAKRVGLLFQNPDRQICCNTIAEEIAFGFKNCELPQEEIDATVAGIIEDFGFEGDRDPFSVSRGERQKIALASIIAVAPEIIILDEPTTGLDYRECIHIMDKVTALNEAGTTIIMVCHDMELVLDYAKRVIVVAAGQIIADGSAHEVFRDTYAMQTASLLPPQIIELATELGDDFEQADTVEQMVDIIKARKAV